MQILGTNRAHAVLGAVPKAGLAAMILAALMAAHAHAAGPTQTPQVQVSSLEVKARIASMEQVNVTAEKTIDASVPDASADVESLLGSLLEQMNEVEGDAAVDAERLSR